jgi:endonuclease YncB( thermonuclease family)
MAKIRLQSEWKMWAGLAVLLLLIIGYLYYLSRPPMEDGEYLWKVTRVIDDKTLSLRGSGTIIRFKLIGLIVPPSQVQTVRDYLTKSLENQWVRIKVIRDESKDVKDGFVFYQKEDVIARMIRQGLAEVDRNETSFDVRNYIELEQEAKRERKGLWQQAG